MENKYIYTEEHQLYDRLSEICLINLYTLSKETNSLVFSDFNTKNKNHKFILEVALILKNIIELDIYINTKNYFNYLFYLLKNKHFIKKIKYSKDSTKINIEEILKHITDANSIKNENIWSEIYDLNFNRKQASK